MSLNLSAEDIAALEDRTEGWIAGLQLAALALQGLAAQKSLSVKGHQGIPEFIRAFAGDHRYIVDYLVEEVLQRQPEPVRSFLLQTAILDRLNGPLCDAVTGQEGGSAQLEALERGNFFVVPLDDRRHWYRYHHLFAEVLVRAFNGEAARSGSCAAPARERVVRAEWFDGRCDPPCAAAGDFERTADLVELAVPAMRRSRQEAMLLGWLKALPTNCSNARPVLSIHFGATMLQSGELDSVEDRLRDAERWLGTTAGKGEPPRAPNRDGCRG